MQAVRVTTEKKKSIIQATGTITNGRTGPLHHLPNRAKRPVGNRAKEKSSGSFGSRNAFLTTQLKPIYTQQLVCEWDDEKTNYITQENYEYLRDSYFSYARILNKVPHHQPGKSIGEGIHNLYQQMNELVGNQINVNIEFEGNRLCFRLWQTHGWGAYTLYWFPVKFVETLNTQLRLIYDTGDTMNEYMVDHFNSNCRESYELVPTTTLDLSPDITTLFSMDDYPERFFEWADRFTYHIT